MMNPWVQVPGVGRAGVRALSQRAAGENPANVYVSR